MEDLWRVGMASSSKQLANLVWCSCVLHCRLQAHCKGFARGRRFASAGDRLCADCSAGLAGLSVAAFPHCCCCSGGTHREVRSAFSRPLQLGGSAYADLPKGRKVRKEASYTVLLGLPGPRIFQGNSCCSVPLAACLLLGLGDCGRRFCQKAAGELNPDANPFLCHL